MQPVAHFNVEQHTSGFYRIQKFGPHAISIESIVNHTAPAIAQTFVTMVLQPTVWNLDNLGSGQMWNMTSSNVVEKKTIDPVNTEL